MVWIETRPQPPRRRLRSHLLLNDLGRYELNWLDGSVLSRLARVHLHDNVLPCDDLAKDRVLGWRGLVEEVQEVVVHGIEEELRPTAVGLSGVSHGQSHGLVRVLGAPGLAELILDRPTGVTLQNLTRVVVLVGGVGLRASSTSPAGVGVLAKGAAKLHHKVRNRSVHVQTVVKSALCQINEVRRRNGHIIEQLYLNRPLGGFKLDLDRHLLLYVVIACLNTRNFNGNSTYLTNHDEF